MYGSLPYFDGSKGDAKPALSSERGLLTQQAQSQLFHASRQRKVFTTSMAAAGAVLPIFSGTTQQFGLFNPMGSGRFCNIIEIGMTYVDTTGAAGGYVLALVKDAGGGKATGGNLTSYTKLSVWDAISDGNEASDYKAFGLTAFGCTAPVIYRHLGQNQLVTTAADATTVPWTARHRFDGDVGIRPGTVLCVAGNIATLTKWAVSITWSEEPI
jgi:hypothetical protein